MTEISTALTISAKHSATLAILLAALLLPLSFTAAL